MVEGPSQRSGIGRETLAAVRKWSGDPLEGPEVVGGLSRRSGSGRGTFQEVWKWSGDPYGGP